MPNKNMIMSTEWSQAGEQMSTSWKPILQLLKAVPEAVDAAYMSLASQSTHMQT